MESYRRLYIWVEGSDDERFFRSIVIPLLTARYDDIHLTRYAGLAPDKVNNFLVSIRSMNADYIFVSDVDTAPCVTARKAMLTTRYRRLEANNVIVVKAEIESWYLAGLDADTCTRLKLRPVRDTQTVTKEHFFQMMPGEFRSSLDFMVEVLKHHTIETARAQNASFDYFARKHSL